MREPPVVRSLVWINVLSAFFLFIFCSFVLFFFFFLVHYFLAFLCFTLCFLILSCLLSLLYFLVFHLFNVLSFFSPFLHPLVFAPVLVSLFFFLHFYSFLCSSYFYIFCRFLCTCLSSAVALVLTEFLSPPERERGDLIAAISHWSTRDLLPDSCLVWQCCVNCRCYIATYISESYIAWLQWNASWEDWPLILQCCFNY